MHNYIVNVAIELVPLWISFVVLLLISYLIFGKNKNFPIGVELALLIIVSYSAIVLIQSDTSYKHEPFNKELEAQQLNNSNNQEQEPIVIQDLTKELKPNVGDFEKLKTYKKEN